MRRPRRLGLLVLGALPFLLGLDRPGGLGDVNDVRYWSHPDYTRVVVELTRPVDVDIQRLPEDASQGRPDRLFLDLEGIWVGRKWLGGIEVGDGLLQRVRLGQNTRKKARLVLDLDRIERYRLIQLSSPDRLVVDVYGERAHPETLEWHKPGAPERRLSLPLRSVETVVIDPGHGGRDPGAIGHKGIREKDVNLRLALILAKRLEGRGFRVILTRKNDRTLDLEERTALAEAAAGDVFVSLHANASSKRATRGIEIYYLDVADQRHNRGVAARENGISRSEVDSLQRTLAHFRVSEASAHSELLADVVHDSVVKEVKRESKDLPDLGVKTGPFYVLFLSSMPSILVESGFLTNKSDARLLRDRDFLGALADGIADGLVTYRTRASKLAFKGMR